MHREREIGSFKEKALWTSILKVCFSFFLSGAFGCAAGAFSYSTLSNRKNFEADALNPNLYSSLENLKDNRKMENLYDELSKKAIASATVPRRGKFIIMKCKKHIIIILKSQHTFLVVLKTVLSQLCFLPVLTMIAITFHDYTWRFAANFLCRGNRQIGIHLPWQKRQKQQS